MFDKQKPSGRLEHPRHFTERTSGVGNTAQCPRRHDRIDPSVLQRNRFGRAFDKFDRTKTQPQISARHRKQFRRGIKANYMPYVARVKGQVESGTNTNFKHLTFSRRDDTAAISGKISLPHRQIDQQWNDLILVETHGYSKIPWAHYSAGNA